MFSLEDIAALAGAGQWSMPQSGSLQAFGALCGLYVMAMSVGWVVPKSHPFT